MDAPPSRYHVVERGRRLVVIDRQTGQPVKHDASDARRETSRVTTPQRRPIEAAPGKVDDASGAAILTTSRIYDLKAPRRIVMNDRFNERVGKAIGGWLVAALVAAGFAIIFMPWLLFVPVGLMFQPKARAGIRQWMTARLDEVQAA